MKIRKMNLALFFLSISLVVFGGDRINSASFRESSTIENIMSNPDWVEIEPMVFATVNETGHVRYHAFGDKGFIYMYGMLKERLLEVAEEVSQEKRAEDSAYFSELADIHSALNFLSSALAAEPKPNQQKVASTSTSVFIEAITTCSPINQMGTAAALVGFTDFGPCGTAEAFAVASGSPGGSNVVNRTISCYDPAIANAACHGPSVCTMYAYAGIFFGNGSPYNQVAFDNSSCTFNGIIH